LKNIERCRISSEEEIRQGVEAIRSGLVVAVPTETFYGLAVDPGNSRAIAALFALKKRPRHKPILLLIASMEQLGQFAHAVPPQYHPLMDRYWPGPLTLVFPARAEVSSLLTGGTGTIGIRLTSHPVARRIISLLGSPITATSANLAQHEPARTAEQVREIFGEKLGAVIDAGPADDGPGSTVVNHIDGKLCVERKGRIVLPALPDCPNLL